ncbi:hypothetical protein, partial [Arthrobacter sp. M2012083]|uniref:hypothetical protein n=1 Tax=Arthrobacter sp. M2012083 TaxID=1197706 RepID=UPI001ED9546B
PAQTLGTSRDGSSRSYFYSRCFNADNGDSVKLGERCASAVLEKLGIAERRLFSHRLTAPWPDPR